jgi:hypothetical protein
LLPISLFTSPHRKLVPEEHDSELRDITDESYEQVKILWLGESGVWPVSSQSLRAWYAGGGVKFLAFLGDCEAWFDSTGLRGESREGAGDGTTMARQREVDRGETSRERKIDMRTIFSEESFKMVSKRRIFVMKKSKSSSRDGGDTIRVVHMLWRETLRVDVHKES